MRIAGIWITLLSLISIAGCYHSQPSSSVEKYEEILEPLVYLADKEYMTRIFGEPTSISNLSDVDIWNYYIPLDDKSNTSSTWHSNTNTHPFQKYHNISLFFKEDTLVNWKAEIRD